MQQAMFNVICSQKGTNGLAWWTKVGSMLRCIELEKNECQKNEWFVPGHELKNIHAPATAANDAPTVSSHTKNETTIQLKCKPS
jgi:hypothetical protein